MKTSGLLYSSETKKHASERILGKNDLRSIFPGEDSIVLTISYLVNRKRIGVKREGKYVTKKNYPKLRTKSRIIRL